MESLGDLARRALLKRPDLAIASLEFLPSELFPQLFLDAFHLTCTEVLKAMAQVWPFPVLPLGRLLDEIFPCMKSLEAVMDGLDVLLAQEVRSRRCKLQVLDFRAAGDQFWRQWCGVPVRSLLKGTDPWPVGSSRKGHTSALLEVAMDLTVATEPLPQVTDYLIDWAKERSVHLCCRKMTILHMPIPNICLRSIELNCVQEVEADLFWKTSILEMFISVLGQMRNLQRLMFCTEVPRHLPSEMLRSQRKLVVLFSNQLLLLHSLRELHLDSATFLKGCLNQVLRCLRRPLETLSITECQLVRQDLAHLCQCPNLTRLKALSLRGTNLSVVGERLRVLLENCAATLQDLDLGVCGLRDSHLQAILPGLKVCSQLSILNLRGNRVSMATLVRVLRQLAGLPHLMLEMYPAPRESYSARYVLHQRTFDLLCRELREVLRDLGEPRLILVGTEPCSCEGKIVLHNWKPLLFPVSYCSCQIQKISFPNGERKERLGDFYRDTELQLEGSARSRNM